MITERTVQRVSNNFNNFGESIPDSRLTEPSNGKKYRLREAIIYSKQLGRPLTDKEMRKYEV